MKCPDEPCATHSQVGMHNYVGRALWMEKQHKAGRKQRRCPKCMRWLYRCEFGPGWNKAERERALSDARNTGYHGDPLITHTRSAAAPQTDVDDYVAWCRYTGAGSRRTIVTCDSDAPGAFKVYREKPSLQPAGEENLRAVVAEFRAEAARIFKEQP